MPYTEKAERTIRAVAHGWRPKKKSIKMSQGAAKKLFRHIDKKPK